ILKYSDHKGREITAPLPLGGIGISRYELDHVLYQHALKLGVQVVQDSVTGVEYKVDRFYVKDSQGIVESNFVLGAFGKRSLLDKKLNRDFIAKKAAWLAIKGHY